VPYVALAAWFLFIGRVASTRTLGELISVAWDSLNGLLGWGIVVVPALWLGLVAAGFVPALQRVGSLGLSLLALSSLLVVVVLASGRLGWGEALFLLPCATIAAGSGWLFLRRDRDREP
jgi:hypothetical protein